MMKKQTRSLLQEINDLVPQRDMHFFIESKAVQAIANVQNLISLIEANYSKEDASELTRRLFNSIKSGDQEKFRRGVRYIREAGEK